MRFLNTEGFVLHSRHIARTLLVLLLAGACRSAAPLAQSTPGAPAPEVAVERLLRLSMEKNYPEMGYVFGTAEGPVIRRDAPAEVEKRMYALASLLEHERYTIGNPSPVPGRTGGAVKFDVQLIQRGREYTVPFTTVRANDGRWFVERIGVEAITDPGKS